MKKFLTILLCLTMILSMAACGAGTTGGGAGGVAAKPESVSFATGGTSGTYYGFVGVIGQVLNDKLKDSLSITVESTGASLANIQLIEAGEADFAIVQNDVMAYAYEGAYLFTEPNKTFTAVMSCYPEAIQLIAKTSITSVADLKGKSVSVGVADSGTRFNAEQILGIYGLTFEDCNISYQSFADSVDALRNGTIDAAFVVAGTPTTAVTELATTYEFNIVPIDAEHREALKTEFGFYTDIIIPAGTYSCVKEDVESVAVMSAIIAANTLSEDAVYNFLKAVFDNKAEIATGHAKGELIDLNTAVGSITVPFHPGAIKYYAEQGIEVK